MKTVIFFTILSLGLMAGLSLLHGKVEVPSPVQDNSSIHLTDVEKAWLQQHPVVRVRTYGNYLPFLFPNTENDSIVKELLKIIEQKTSIRFEHKLLLSWPKALEAIQAGEGLDLVPIITPTEERKKDLLFTDIMFKFPTVIFIRKDQFISNATDLADSKIAAVRKLNVTVIAKKKLPFLHLIEVDTEEEALRMVAEGEADAYIGNLATASYMIEKNGFYNIKVGCPSGLEDVSLAMGIRKDLPELHSIVNKAVRSISPQQYQDIKKKWLTIRYEYGISMEKIRNRAMMFLVLVILVVTTILIWNRKLRREIEHRHKVELQLRESIEQIQTLEGLIPICANCKKIRSEQELWSSIESYIEARSEVLFSHTICPDCMEELYKGKPWYEKMKAKKLREEVNC